MPKKSAAAQARHDEKRQALEAELAKYQQLARDLRTSSESTLVKTQRQKDYHKNILELQQQLTRLGT
jgi:hypothetical protein